MSVSNLDKKANLNESFDFDADLYNLDSPQTVIAKAGIKTLLLALKDVNGNVVNSRTAVDVNDTGPGTIAADGTVTIKLDPADHATVGKRIATLTVTWDDAAAVERTGVHDFIYQVVSQI